MTQHLPDNNGDQNIQIIKTVSARSAAESQGSQSGSGSTMEQAKQQAGQLTDQVKQQAAPLADQAKQQATSQVASRKQQATKQLDSIAQAMRETGKHLQEQDQGKIAQYTTKAAEQVERTSSYLRDKNVQALMSDAEHFARRQPTLFLGGAFVLGMLGARFLKSSSSQQ